MKRIVCFFLGHIPDIQIVRVHRITSTEHTISISVTCWCERCGNFLTRKEEPL